ncbi:MAG: molybdopterin-guanine dinucleotide biosynthesis protein MobA [Actinobacteria bacterium HGW-Actinobacteria-8]|nr:MAG: molybdopterin-guanine dinucleotide biosynthesis protein MobA [Actinobacteria bacterium HGW-Actinobacteria-8]
MDVTGVVLAAGGPSGAGVPYSLRKAPDGTPWLETACTALRDAGCREVIVVLGAGADEAMALMPHGALPVVASDWRDGQAVALRVGLAAAATSSADAVLLTLVNVPEQTAAAGRHVLESATDDPRGTLARAHYDGKAGHPVFAGRDHWASIATMVSGDMGIGDYLEDHLTADVDCTDLGGSGVVEE